MDWSDERWVRVYTRDTASWKLLGWQARTVLLHMFRKVDRAGVIDDGGEGSDGLAAALDLPPDVTCHGLSQLVTRGIVVSRGDQHVIPNFLAAQTAVASDAERQRKSRETRRANVTRRDVESQDVTERHAVSRVVTDGHSETRLDETREGECAAKSPHAPAPLELLPTEPPTPCRDRAHELAEACCDALNAATGSRYRPDSDATRKLALSLAKDRRTVAEMQAVVADRVSAWLGDPKMASYLRPATILAPGNFARYLDDIAGRATGSPPRAGSGQPVVRVPTIRRKFL